MPSQEEPSIQVWIHTVPTSTRTHRRLGARSMEQAYRRWRARGLRRRRRCGPGGSHGRGDRGDRQPSAAHDGIRRGHRGDEQHLATRLCDGDRWTLHRSLGSYVGVVCTQPGAGFSWLRASSTLLKLSHLTSCRIRARGDPAPMSWSVAGPTRKTRGWILHGFLRVWRTRAAACVHSCSSTSRGGLHD